MTWYEDPAQYSWDSNLPQEIKDAGGPQGVALVDVYKDGKTTGGWGLIAPDPGRPGFMTNYTKRKFWDRPRLIDFTKNAQPYAIVMRSVSLIAVDIDRHMDDGGADGFKAAAKLGLDETLSETSKSGAGRHLFYRVPDVWDDRLGFAMYDDALGLAPGIDIRAVGCMYRYPSQKWDHRQIAPLPDTLVTLLEERKTKKQNRINILSAASAGDADDLEVMIMHDTLLKQLAGPIPNGKRNATLFAIGTDMKKAAVPNWDQHLQDRANEIGLDAEEAAKIVANIEKYAA